MEVLGEIFVVPFFGQGHLFPCMELCKHLSSLNCKAILVIPSHLSSSVPSSLRGGRSSLIEIAEIPYSPASRPPEMTVPPPPLRPEKPTGSGPGVGFGPGPNPFRRHHDQMGAGLEAFLAERCKDPTQTRPVCAILDVMMSWSKEFFAKFGIRTVSFFTSGACSFSMQYAIWKERAEEMKQGETRKFSGLPAEMELSYSGLQRRQPHSHKHANNLRGPPMDGPDEVNKPLDGTKFGPPGMKFFPLGPGGRPMWLADTDGSSALLFNTCYSLENPFLKYITDQIDKPVYGVGPLLPNQYWKSPGSILLDGQVRSNRESNYREDQVMEWLDSKPRRSVIYVSFGSEVGPSWEECTELADALGELNRPFIWVVQPNAGKSGPPRSLNLIGGRLGSGTKEEGYYPDGLEERIGDRALIIKGWAPQLMILSHPALGGFLSHCGWNSTVESIGRGVPILAWPIRGDQFDNAKLVASHLRVGHLLLADDEEEEEDRTQMVKKENIVRGIECLLDDKEVSEAAEELSHIFSNGFPSTSMAALKSFVEALCASN